MSLFEELKWRGLIKDVSDEALAKKKFDGSPMKFYVGYDPTGKSLTVGHLVQIVRMKLIQSYGHMPVVLVGGATGLIGDPRPTTERQLLTLNESLENANLIKVQISKFLDPKNTMYVNNYDWIKDIDMITFLRDFGKNFTINYMLAKDTVAKRLETGISYTEFSYMLLQAIDFWHLYKKEGVSMQFGGSDQWGNITTGLELIKKLEGENDAVGLSSPLLLKSDGNKFGKSESGTIWLDENLTSPYELYQYFLNTPDSDVVTYLKTLTLLKKEEIINLEKSMISNPELREAQRALAREVTLFVHKKEGLEEATMISEALFSGNFSLLNQKAFATLTKGMDEIKVNLGDNILDCLVASKLASSKREAREFVLNGAILINDLKIDDINYIINKEDSYFDKYIVIRRGKKKYAILSI
ncbi:tyrosine--tRNA ligase [Acholeplasma sp. OttesenSCG-928-E16]|nr:tyrosine--tRNA ligase [Acholeplasma sp. OttesenSCG-928-E16]